MRLGRPVERDSRGREISSLEVLQRGRLVIGLRLQQERARDTAVGRKLRTLSVVELQCLNAAVGADIDGHRPA
jgi:hypothetical protein